MTLGAVLEIRVPPPANVAQLRQIYANHTSIQTVDMLVTKSDFQFWGSCV